MTMTLFYVTDFADRLQNEILPALRAGLSALAVWQPFAPGELRVFVTVLEHRSFRKAAAVLHLSQPAVTKAIASLEETLGCRLFHRVANGVEVGLSASVVTRDLKKAMLGQP